MERAEQRLRQFESERSKIWKGVAEQVTRADKLLVLMLAEAREMGCIPKEHFVDPGQLGSRKAKTTPVEALDLGQVPKTGHGLLIPHDDGTFAIVTAERRGIYTTQRQRSGLNRSRLDYQQFSTRFTPVKSPLLALRLRLEATRQLGEIMQTAIELKKQREEEKRGN